MCGGRIKACKKKKKRRITMEGGIRSGDPRWHCRKTRLEEQRSVAGGLDNVSKVEETVERVKQNFGECREGKSEADLRSGEAGDTDVRRRVVLFQPL